MEKTAALSKATIKALATTPGTSQRAAEHSHDSSGSEDGGGSAKAPTVKVTNRPLSKEWRSEGVSGEEDGGGSHVLRRTTRTKEPNPLSAATLPQRRKPSMGGVDGKRGDLADELYSLMSQATEKDINKDSDFKNECSRILGEIFDELKVCREEAASLVAFSLRKGDEGSVRHGSRSREGERTLSAATSNARNSAETVQANYVFSPSVNDTILDNWGTSLQIKSSRVDEIFKVLEPKLYEEEGGFSSSKMIKTFVLDLLQEYEDVAEKGGHVDLDAFMVKQGLESYMQCEETSGRVLSDEILQSLPVEIFLACAEALDDVSNTFVMLKELFHISSNPGSEEFALQVDIRALTCRGRLELRHIDYPQITQRTRTFRFLSELFCFTRENTSVKLSHLYPDATEDVISDVYAYVSGEIRLKTHRSIGWMFKRFVVPTWDSADFGPRFKQNSSTIRVPNWVTSAPGAREYIIDMAKLFSDDWKGSREHPLMHAEESARELVFLSIFCSQDFFQDWSTILQKHDAQTLQKVFVGLQLLPTGVWAIAQGKHFGTIPINVCHEIFNVALYWPHIQTRSRFEEKIVQLCTNKCKPRKKKNLFVLEEPLLFRILEFFYDLLMGEKMSVNTFTRKYRCSRREIQEALDFFRANFVTEKGAEWLEKDMFDVTTWPQAGPFDDDYETREHEGKDEVEDEDGDATQSSQVVYPASSQVANGIANGLAIGHATDPTIGNAIDPSTNLAAGTAGAAEPVVENEGDEQIDGSEGETAAEHGTQSNEEEDDDEAKELPKKKSKAKLVPQTQETPPPSPAHLRSSPRNASRSGGATKIKGILKCLFLQQLKMNHFFLGGGVVPRRETRSSSPTNKTRKRSPGGQTAALTLGSEKAISKRPRGAAAGRAGLN